MFSIYLLDYKYFYLITVQQIENNIIPSYEYSDNSFAIFSINLVEINSLHPYNLEHFWQNEHFLLQVPDSLISIIDGIGILS